ncbi:RNA-directed DNA polymerase from mobile element jockey-like [Brachionus plicatilis]|uniref:RNA-directed DNA polymerase from mobile element jockey-like n=1 Tax=Brachionus plicatilis TaxID=10195 RepID=A0A3M7T949_BRAPC|nr:RNA-directed DNA polymerase from mobile element jockey-like [Brachionus plicatilis]
MNASKCCYTIFSGGGRGRLKMDLRLSGDLIPYNPNPLFLGVTFDEYLCFNKQFQNLRVRALKRLNIIKIFAHSSWHLKKTTLTSIYNALIGSMFDYFFFTVACISKTNLKLVQTVQNRAIRCIYKLRWDSPTRSLFSKDSYKWVLDLLVEEYSGSWSENTAKVSVTSTPVGAFFSIIRIAYACTVLIKKNLFLMIKKKSLRFDGNDKSTSF